MPLLDKLMGKKDPKEQVNQWTKSIRAEQRQLTRQIQKIFEK